MYSIHIKRVYDEPVKRDGYRILVDRIWPRGLKKEDAELDEWAKEIAPSSEIRKEFNHDHDRMDEFKKKYKKELNHNKDAEEFVEAVEEKLKKRPVTLVYAAKDEKANQAVVLKEWLQHKIKK